MFSATQIDRQWTRRCKVEEFNLVDSYAGSKAQKLADMSQQKPSFYAPPIYSNLDLLKQKTKVTYPEEKKREDDDLISDVSKVSVLTPKTEMSGTRVSYHSVRTGSKQDDRLSSVS